MAWPKLQITVHAIRRGEILCGQRKRSPRGSSLVAVENPAAVTCKRCLLRLAALDKSSRIVRD